MKNIFKLELASNRIFGLDFLRALAIIFVLISHSELQLPKSLQGINKIFYFDGVLIFFVLSGFLIGKIFIKLLEKNHLNYSLLYDFWQRRWWRTLPAYLFTIIILIILNLIFKPNFKLEETWKYFFFLQNINSANLSFFGESWSLAVEEWFYLLMPIITLIFFKLMKFSVKKAILYYIILTMIGSLAIRHIKYEIYDPKSIHDWASYFKDTVNTRLDSLSFGVLAAYISYYFPNIFKKYNNIKYVILGLGGFFLIRYIILFEFIERASYFNTVISFTLQAILIAITLPYFSNLKSSKSHKFSTFITKISIISYSLYLLNLSIITDFIINNINLYKIFSYEFSRIFNYLLFYLLTYYGAILMYKYVEQPFLKFRDK